MLATGCAGPIGHAPMPTQQTAAEVQPVTGTRAATGNDARRVTVIDREVIDRSGAMTIGELLKGPGRR